MQQGFFGGELLDSYRDAQARVSAGADASEALLKLVAALERCVDDVPHELAFEPQRGLVKRVAFEILQHFTRTAELGRAGPAVARLLGNTCLFAPIPHERFLITQDWFSANIPVWQGVFVERAHAPNLSCLEIGSFEGMSACYLLERVLTHATSRIVCIDPFDAPGQPQAERYFDHNVRVTGQSHKVTKLKGYSKQALPFLQGSRFDIAYIDGSHHPRHALEDALAVWPLLNPRALVIFDDYAIGSSYPPDLARDVDPKPGIDAFLSFVPGEYREVTRGYQLIIEKLEEN